MASTMFDCTECAKSFNMRMKLNRHIAKDHQVEVDFLKPQELTEEQKEKHFDTLREKYFYIKEQVSTMEKKCEYFESRLKTTNKTNIIQNVKKVMLKSSVKNKKTKRKRFKKKPVGRDGAEGTYEDIPEDHSIPVGWRSAIKHSFMPTCNKRIRNKVYWAPDGRYCSSRVQALAYMLAEELPSKDIEHMKAGMAADSWQAMEELPEGWMARPDTKGLLKYVTADFQQLRNCRSALKHLLAHGGEQDTAKFVAFQFIKDVVAEEVRWQHSAAVPFRWKVGLTVSKAGTRGLVILCPDGQVFTSVKNLQEMISKNEIFQLENLDPFLAFLSSVKYRAELAGQPDWTPAGGLPAGWMRRASAGRQASFLNPQGRVFHSRAAVSQFLQGEEVVEVRQEQEGKVEWRSEAGLPDGWSSRPSTGAEGGRSFKDSRGRVHPGRVEAIKHMLLNDSDTASLELMKTGLLADGWRVVEYLPAGWMIRKYWDSKGQKKQEKTKYLTPQLQVVRTMGEVISCMKEQGVDEEERMKALNHKWSQDPDLPPGILTNKVFNEGVKQNSFRSYITLEGKFFPSIYHLLRHLQATDIGLVDQVRPLLLTQQSFVGSELLPEGWLFRGGLKVRRAFITPDYQKLSSKEEVVAYMKGKGVHEEEVAKFESNYETLMGLDEAQEKPKPKPGGLQWITDPSLPEGWRFAPYNPKLLSSQNKKLCKYLSPSGDFFNSKPAALRHLLAAGATGEEVERMAAGLVEEGYTSSPHLPEGWRVKTGTTWFIFLSPTFETFSTVKKCKEHMEENNFAAEDIKKLEENFMVTVIKPEVLKRKAEDMEEVEDEEWEDHYLLPEGWKFRLGPDGAPAFLAEDGTRLKNVKVAKMRVRSGRMGLDSHGEARLLSNLICFAASFRETKVVEVVPAKRSKPEEKVEEKKIEVPEKVTAEVLEGGDVEESIPAGWKMAKFSGEEDVLLTSPQGKLFLSRRAALEWLVRSGYSDAAVSRLRESLGREGWREGEGLPEGWRWRPCPTSGEARLLTREARVVHGAREVELVVSEGEEKEQVVRWSW